MELIFEIGCEELPARFVEPALEQMKDAFVEACGDRRIDGGDVEVVGTPRRLTLIAEQLADAQSDLEEQRTGPPADIAFDDAGQPTAAAKGFARGQGVEPSELYTVDTEKGEYLAAQIFEQGAATETLLPRILTEIIEGLQFPKSMRWASGDATFGRPVRWMMAVADGEVVPVEFAGVESGDVTYGHRFSAPEAIEVDSVESYRSQLADADVVVDPERRRAIICSELDERARAVGGRIVDDPGLVDEVVYLVEKPHAVTLEYGEPYLELPREVLISSMRSHQRYFAVEEPDKSGLRPACIVIYNTPVRDPEVVEKGNLKVLRARLDDARFFWDKDLNRSLEEHRDKLDDVIWIGSLGTIYERTERMASLAEEIARRMDLSEEAEDGACRAARLSKADLTTEMVHEFPDLQGVMGREYALRSDESDVVARAIEEQYLPESSGGSLPESDVGACVALAEKIDAIVGCFGIDMVPTASSDPYGLRRAALGVLAILSDRNSRLSLSELVRSSVATYTDGGVTPFDKSDGAVISEAVDFLVTRHRYLLEEDFPTGVVNSVLAAGVDDVPSVYGRVEALTELRGREDFEPLALGFKRVVNILEKQVDHLDLEDLNVDSDRFEDASEQALFEATARAREALHDNLKSRQWSAACRTLIKLKGPVDEFFDSVMVMADDDALRRNRLALLADLRDLFFAVADISHIQT